MPEPAPNSGASFGHAGVELLRGRLHLRVVVRCVRVEAVERSVVLVGARLLGLALRGDLRLVLGELLVDRLDALRARRALLLGALRQADVLVRDRAALPG